MKRLQAQGIDTASARMRGQLDVLLWRDTYLPERTFDKQGMLGTMEEMLQTGSDFGLWRPSPRTAVIRSQ